MTKQYWIGGFFVDLSRNQLTQNKQSQTLAPKALAVLTYLAENKGEVVSHEALLAEVWPDTVVSPNTLQRSIAQLRKALGDDGKVQVYIKTHAKQGYSLECDVRWDDNNNPINNDSKEPNDTAHIKTDKSIVNEGNIDSSEATHTTTTHQTKPLSFNLTFVVTALLIISMCVVGFQYLTPKPSLPLSITEIRSLTATDSKENAGIYSPDGKYIVFHRYSDVLCVNNIWAKNVETKQEFKLTQNLETYGSHSFSTDGKKLAFIQSVDCSKPITQKTCYKLMTLDFNQALQSPQSPQELMECKNSQIQTPKWLNNNNIALLQKTSGHWKLINYSVSENKSQVIYEVNDGNIIYYDYSVENNLFAVATIHHDGNYYIEILKADGQLLSSHQIKRPKALAKFKNIYPVFSPLKDQLIFSTGKQLFTLSFEGEVTRVSIPLDEPVGSPVFHPNGDRMLVIKGHYDSDVISAPLAQLVEAQATQSKSSNLSAIERSNVGEDNAIFQPNGKFIAYQSERSGEDQVWISDNKNSKQLSHFPIDTYIYGMDWAADGNSLLVNTNNTLTQLHIDSSQKAFALAHPVVHLFQWDSKSNSALVLMRIKGIVKFVELNLTSSKMRIIADKPVSWALKSESGHLVYLDKMERFWQSGAVEDQHIEALDGQGSDKRFVIKNNVIYGVNDDLKLWSYDLESQEFERFGELPKNLDYLTDINQTQLLMTNRISAKKEVAELILSK